MRGLLYVAVALAVIITGAGIVYPRGMAGIDREPYIPAPRLVSPVTSEVDLAGQETLKFIWSAHEGSRLKRRYYDFRLYSGIGTTEVSLILKKQVDPGTWSLELDAKTFETGRYYTWSLRQVYDADGKSRRNTWTFKVIRRQEVAKQ
jgi:hypothetical protein